MSFAKYPRQLRFLRAREAAFCLLVLQAPLLVLLSPVLPNLLVKRAIAYLLCVIKCDESFRSHADPQPIR
mgnify:CR=1 FL=1|jgi:hypothetical protein